MNQAEHLLLKNLESLEARIEQKVQEITRRTKSLADAHTELAVMLTYKREMATALADLKELHAQRGRT